ncbi:Hypothetical predicted protein [Olea europaea subsp. europaea]|uniref:Uncharacterized protein n=1 Tax=Olea europaea subsp. europaea TaxID=158383 RepID=A0A8S0SAI2_OLEEU|nr:Hypothetical predicted protein [Olea europaea subsp. europaea]
MLFGSIWTIDFLKAITRIYIASNVIWLISNRTPCLLHCITILSKDCGMNSPRLPILDPVNMVLIKRQKRQSTPKCSFNFSWALMIPSSTSVAKSSLWILFPLLPDLLPLYIKKKRNASRKCLYCPLSTFVMDIASAHSPTTHGFRLCNGKKCTKCRKDCLGH